MRKLLIIAAALMAVMTACDLVTLSTNGSEKDEDCQWGNVSFGISDYDGIVSTKSRTQASETAINTLQILVYDSSQELVTYGSSTGSSVDMTVPLGASGHTVYAVVNVSDNLSSCSTLSSLTSRVSYLKDNPLTSLQMIGKKTNLTFSAGSQVSVAVSRFASRVEIDKITADFKSEAHRNMDVYIKAIYLINVDGSCSYSGAAASDTWYNKMRYVSGDCNALISDIFPSQVKIQSTGGTVTPYTNKHYFYCYANPTTDNPHGGNTFTPRHTRLVVEVLLGTRVYYYPVDIVGTDGKLNSNTTYTVTQMTITGPGADNPDDELNNGSINFNVTVTDWQNGFSKPVTY